MERIAAGNLARLAPSDIRGPALTFAAAVAAWPTDHEAITTAPAVAAAHTLDAWAAAHCH